MKIVHDDCSGEQLLADFRLVIWKILLGNARDIVQIVQRSNLGHVNRASKVRVFRLTLPSVPRDGVPSLQANCEYIMNHRSDTDNPEFFFLPGFAQVVQDLWADDVIPLLSDSPSALHLADNAE
jgi:hypothetical protein